MKHVCLLDDNGYFLYPVAVRDNFVLSNNYAKTLPPSNLIKPKYMNGVWIEGVALDELKQRKYKELDIACETTILGRFKALVDRVEYEFSYDEKAQSRFNGTAALFALNALTEIDWTAYVNGERTRITLDKTKFLQVAGSAAQHQDSNVVKFNELLIQLDNAQSISEIEKIVW